MEIKLGVRRCDRKMRGTDGGILGSWVVKGKEEREQCSKRPVLFETPAEPEGKLGLEEFGTEIRSMVEE